MSVAAGLCGRAFARVCAALPVEVKQFGWKSSVLDIFLKRSSGTDGVTMFTRSSDAGLSHADGCGMWSATVFVCAAPRGRSSCTRMPSAIPGTWTVLSGHKTGGVWGLSKVNPAYSAITHRM
jgi:hypothetical protein